MALPGVRTTAVQLGLVVQPFGPSRTSAASCEHEVAAGHLELGGEERREGVEADARGSAPGRRPPSPRPPTGTSEPLSSASSITTLSKASASRMPSQTDWSRASTSLRLGQPRGHLEHVLEHALVLGGRGHVLGDPDGQGRVPRARHERVQLGVGGPAAGLGLVDRHDAEELAARAAQRHEQRVVGLPGVGIVGGLDLGDVGAARDLLPVEASVAARSRRRGARSAARAAASRSRAARSGRAASWIDSSSPTAAAVNMSSNAGPVDVHHHGAIAERLADRARHLPEHVLQVLVRAHGGRALEHGAEPADDRERAGVHHGRDAHAGSSRVAMRDVSPSLIFVSAAPGERCS